MDSYTMTCLCGTTADQHAGKDHPFLEKRPSYDPATWYRGARFGHENLQPAGNLYITVEDRLRVLILNRSGSVQLDINARIQRPDGQVIPLKQSITTLVSGAFQAFELDLTEGFLLDVVANCVTANVHYGQVYVTVQLIRGASPNSIPTRVLIAAYAQSNVVIGWPDFPNQALTAGVGIPGTFNVANPGAGADWTFISALGDRSVVVSVEAVLTTAVAVANRVPHLQIQDTNNSIVFDVAAAAAQAASTVVRYSWIAGVQPVINDGAAIAPLPENLILVVNHKIRTVTTAIQAADQWSAINIYIQSLLEA
jgi:hypothetical protein